MVIGLVRAGAVSSACAGAVGSTYEIMAIAPADAIATVLANHHLRPSTIRVIATSAQQMPLPLA
jgi:hypothetical protein